MLKPTNLMSNTTTLITVWAMKMDLVFNLKSTDGLVQRDDQVIMNVIQFIVVASVPISFGLRACQLVVSAAPDLEGLLVDLRSVIQATLSLFSGVSLLVDRVTRLAVKRRPKVRFAW